MAGSSSDTEPTLWSLRRFKKFCFSLLDQREACLSLPGVNFSLCVICPSWNSPHIYIFFIFFSSVSVSACVDRKYLAYFSGNKSEPYRYCCSSCLVCTCNCPRSALLLANLMQNSGSWSSRDVRSYGRRGGCSSTAPYWPGAVAANQH